MNYKALYVFCLSQNQLLFCSVFIRECVVFFATGIGREKTYLVKRISSLEKTGACISSCHASRITLHGINHLGISDVISLRYGNEAVENGPGLHVAASTRCSHLPFKCLFAELDVGVAHRNIGVDRCLFECFIVSYMEGGVVDPFVYAASRTFRGHRL
jgi:hypothetical protein